MNIRAIKRIYDLLNKGNSLYFETGCYTLWEGAIRLLAGYFQTFGGYTRQEAWLKANRFDDYSVHAGSRFVK